jgi:DNA-binding LytR/AlgR family response regulator
MKKYNCLIVDDEPIAREIMLTFIDEIEELECIGECKNGSEALEKINTDSNIDIVFLDINMPNFSGISVVKSLSKLPQIIFSTAHHEHAVESYELDAADYILKPYSLDRFKKSAQKAIDRIEKQILINEGEKSEQLFLVKSEGNTYPIKTSHILYCEAMRNYTKIFLSNGQRLIPYVAFSKFELDIKPLNSDLVRVHRSFLINKKHISAINSQNVIIGKKNIPIGDQYRTEFAKSIADLNK